MGGTENNEKSNVTNIFGGVVLSFQDIERFRMMKARQEAVTEGAMDACKQMVDRAATVPDGHLARINDGGEIKVMLALTQTVELICGATEVSRFAESDDTSVPTRMITKDQLIDDLGTYGDFMGAHDVLWGLVLKSKRCPAGGLPMAQAVERLVRTNSPQEEESVDTALNIMAFEARGKKTKSVSDIADDLFCV